MKRAFLPQPTEQEVLSARIFLAQNAAQSLDGSRMEFPEEKH